MGVLDPPRVALCALESLERFRNSDVLEDSHDVSRALPPNASKFSQSSPVQFPSILPYAATPYLPRTTKSYLSERPPAFFNVCMYLSYFRPLQLSAYLQRFPAFSPCEP